MLFENGEDPGSGASYCALKCARAAGWIAICSIRLSPYLPYSLLFKLNSLLLFIRKQPKARINPGTARFSLTEFIRSGTGPEVLEAEDRARFEQLVLPHLDAAFNLASWILSNRSDAEDVTQEAMLRAYRFFGGFYGGDLRAWLLQIVRNTSYTWLEKNRRMQMMDEFNEELHMQSSATPESIAIASSKRLMSFHPVSAKLLCFANCRGVPTRRLLKSLQLL